MVHRCRIGGPNSSAYLTAAEHHVGFFGRCGVSPPVPRRLPRKGGLQRAIVQVLPVRDLRAGDGALYRWCRVVRPPAMGDREGEHLPDLADGVLGLADRLRPSTTSRRPAAFTASMVERPIFGPTSFAMRASNKGRSVHDFFARSSVHISATLSKRGSPWLAGVFALARLASILKGDRARIRQGHDGIAAKPHGDALARARNDEALNPRTSARGLHQ